MFIPTFHRIKWILFCYCQRNVYIIYI